VRVYEPDAHAVAGRFGGIPKPTVQSGWEKIDIEVLKCHDPEGKTSGSFFGEI
jgi:hypothetical protein